MLVVKTGIEVLRQKSKGSTEWAVAIKESEAPLCFESPRLDSYVSIEPSSQLTAPGYGFSGVLLTADTAASMSSSSSLRPRRKQNGTDHILVSYSRRIIFF